MNSLIQITLLFIGLISGVTFSQNTVGTILNSPATNNGFTLLAPVNSQQTYLIDNCGRELKSWNSDYQMGMSAYLSEDGSLYRAGRVFNADMMMGGIGGVFERFDWNGNLTWQYFVSGADSVAHHDFKLLPNGNLLIIVAHNRPLTEAYALGRDSVNMADTTLFEEVIYEIKPLGFDSAQIVWEWRVWDHLIQDRDSLKPNYGDISAFPHRMNINYFSNPTGRDWMHANSVDFNPELNQILISFRHTNEIWIIDHSTTSAEASGSQGGIYGKGGDILYRWGNPIAYDRGTLADQKLFGQHKAVWIQQGLPGAGNVLLFNNGNNFIPSAVFEFETPILSSGIYTDPGVWAYGPNQPIWIYSDSANVLFNSGRLSSAQRLTNGNTLICSGQIGNIIEVDVQNNPVWNYRNPISNTGIIAQGNIPGAGTNSVFNATKYNPDYSAFSGIQLVASDPLELNFNLQGCEVAGFEIINQNQPVKTEIYPNPVNHIATINSESIISVAHLLTLEGKLIESFYPNSRNFNFDMTLCDSGTFIVQLVFEEGAKKCILIMKD
jgi:hypothetical protein